MAKGLSLEDFAKMHGVDREEEKTQQKNFSGKKNSGNKKIFNNSNNSGQNNKNFSANTTATAPYNFVSLPEKILPSPIEDIEDYKEQVADPENLSGEIEIDIESLTPLFIGGNGEKSFAPVTEIIPGSSLRGMFKNIFKIVTCGAFRGCTGSQKKGEDFNDEHIYFRCLMAPNSAPAWMEDLHKLYGDRMTSTREGKPVKNARPGFLIQKTDGNFFIAPAIYRSDRKDDKILIKEYEKKFNDRVQIRNDSRVTWHGNIAYIITGSQRADKLLDKKAYERVADKDKKKLGKQFIRFTKIDYVDWSRDHWIELPEDVRLSYEHDRNRKGVNLFKDKGILKRAKIEEMTGKSLPDVKTLVPCHFLEEGGTVTAFGHGQCFRIPYKKAIGKLVPENLKDEKIIDFADAIFGRESFWASRVFFEDAKPVETIQTLSPDLAHVLAQPNPTSYQLYLKQEEGKKLNHWDSNGAQLRGYKMYWHLDKNDVDWQANDDERKNDSGKPDDKKLCKKITPLKEGRHFTAKIRFQNLTKIELGALLMIFDLNDAKNPAYKIGMGKPLGLGSIKVTPKLFIESETAYTEFFDGDSFKNPYREESFTKYLDAFKNYVKDCDMERIWSDTLKELNEILDLDVMKKVSNWREKIKSMSGNVQSGNVDERFKNRSPLPTISQVLKC